jgi:hypothetical protein
MDAMRSPEPGTVFMSIALIGVGSFAGAFLDRLSFPRMSRVLNVCASSKQFMVEFRIDEPHYYGEGIFGVRGEPLNVQFLKLEVDSAPLEEMGKYSAIRHFFCEGNHRVRIRYLGYHGEEIEHALDFAVSRPSLFHITARSLYSTEVSATCVSKARCGENVAFELSPWEPDDMKVRMLPLERRR